MYVKLDLKVSTKVSYCTFNYLQGVLTSDMETKSPPHEGSVVELDVGCRFRQPQLLCVFLDSAVVQ